MEAMQRAPSAAYGDLLAAELQEILNGNFDQDHGWKAPLTIWSQRFDAWRRGEHVDKIMSGRHSAHQISKAHVSEGLVETPENNVVSEQLLKPGIVSPQWDHLVSSRNPWPTNNTMSSGIFRRFFLPSTPAFDDPLSAEPFCSTTPCSTSKGLPIVDSPGATPDSRSHTLGRSPFEDSTPQQETEKVMGRQSLYSPMVVVTPRKRSSLNDIAPVMRLFHAPPTSQFHEDENVNAFAQYSTPTRTFNFPSDHSPLSSQSLRTQYNINSPLNGIHPSSHGRFNFLPVAPALPSQPIDSDPAVKPPIPSTSKRTSNQNTRVETKSAIKDQGLSSDFDIKYSPAHRKRAMSPEPAFEKQKKGGPRLGACKFCKTGRKKCVRDKNQITKEYSYGPITQDCMTPCVACVKRDRKCFIHDDSNGEDV